MDNKKETINKVEPIVLDCGKPIEGKVFKGDKFEITKTNKGICYHVYGGYSIFVTPNNTALYQTLDDLIENQDEYASLEGEKRDIFELNLSAIGYVLNLPLFAFINEEFMFDIASMVIAFLQKRYDELTNVPLQEETVDEDLQFKDTALAIEELQKNLKEEDN